MLDERGEQPHRHVRADPEQLALLVIQAHQAHMRICAQKPVEASEQPHRLLGARELHENPAVLVIDKQIASHRD